MLQLHTVLRLAAALESLSSHPIASAFLEHADGHGLEFERCKVEGFKLLEGEGVTGAAETLSRGGHSLGGPLAGGVRWVGEPGSPVLVSGMRQVVGAMGDAGLRRI